jgi:hypothetical protein
VLGGSLVAVILVAAAWMAPPAAAAPGELLWMQSWDPKGDFLYFDTMDLVRGPGGDLWIGSSARASSGGSNQRRPVVARFSQAGAKRWVAVLSGGVDFFYYAGMAVDRGGNAVVAARCFAASPREKWLVTKLSPSGKRLWTSTRMSPVVHSAPGGAMPAGVAVDSKSNIYVAGTIERAVTGRDVALCKYTPAGVLKWTRYIDGFEGSDDRGVAVAVDGADRVYVTGTVGSFFAGTDVMLARYSTAGAQVWKRVWDGDGKDDSVGDLAVSAYGVSVAGASASPAGELRGVVLTVPLTMAEGVPPYVKMTTIPGWNVNWSSVAMNAAGDIAVGCAVDTETVNTCFAYARYQAAVPDVFAYRPSSFGSTSCNDVWIGPDATLLATGTWRSETTGEDLFIVSDFVSTPDWGTILGLNSAQKPRALAVTNSAIYVAGAGYGDIVLWRYGR